MWISHLLYDIQANGTSVLRHSTNKALLLKHPTGATIPVQPKNTFQPKCNLGHYKSPAGIQTTQTKAKAVLAKVKGISQAISQSPISQDSAYALYHPVYRPAVEYVLGQSFVNSSQVQTIQKVSFPWIFNKCDFAKNTSRALLFGP